VPDKAVPREYCPDADRRNNDQEYSVPAFNGSSVYDVASRPVTVTAVPDVGPAGATDPVARRMLTTASGLPCGRVQTRCADDAVVVTDGLPTGGGSGIAEVFTVIRFGRLTRPSAYLAKTA
jgi:hypothetical protein